MIDPDRPSYEGDGAADPIEPSVIKHWLDEISVNGRVSQRYNYLVYVFERGAMRCWARSYSEDNGKVTLYRGMRPDGLLETEWDRFFGDVEVYLRRRFRRVDLLHYE